MTQSVTGKLHTTTALTPTTPMRERMIETMEMANLSKGTIDSYVREIARLANHFRTPPQNLNAEQVRTWLKMRIDRGLAPRTTNVTLAAVQLFYCDVVGLPEVVQGLRYRKVPSQLPKHLEVEEVERLLLATHDLRYRTAMYIGYACALRISEVVALQLTDIRAEKNLLHIRSGKGRTERMVPLPDSVIETLRRYWKGIVPRPTVWLFYGKSEDVPMNISTLQAAFARSRTLARLTDKCSFHCLRHSAATHLHERGGSIDVIQDMLGHKNADTTRGYARATGTMFKSLNHPACDLNVLI